MTAADIVKIANDLRDASDQLVGWLSPGGYCCPNVPRVHGFCTFPPAAGARQEEG